MTEGVIVVMTEGVEEATIAVALIMEEVVLHAQAFHPSEVGKLVSASAGMKIPLYGDGVVRIGWLVVSAVPFIIQLMVCQL